MPEGICCFNVFLVPVSNIVVFRACYKYSYLHILFVVATEACDDDGLPHTLEHLVFLGSEDYPFKADFCCFYCFLVVFCLKLLLFCTFNKKTLLESI